jgi:hypothetical protein
MANSKFSISEATHGSPVNRWIAAEWKQGWKTEKRPVLGALHHECCRPKRRVTLVTDRIDFGRPQVARRRGRRAIQVSACRQADFQ